jgi:glutamine phosphoribosylpyrophosphate amidotransferase
MSWRYVNISLLVITGCFPTLSKAETVTESWMRQAGISCGGGMSVAVQGEIDAAIIKRLKIGSIDGNGTYQKSEAELLLNQFEQEEKSETYTNYINCLITLMNMASLNSGLPPKEVVLRSPVAIASLETIKRGQRFLMVPGESIAIKDHTLIFTVSSISSNRVNYNWSNSESGKNISANRKQAELIKLGEQCTLIPYKIEEDEKQVSFLSNC